MSKRPHSQRGNRHQWRHGKWSKPCLNQPKKAQSYKQNVLDAYQDDVRKQSLIMEIRLVPYHNTLCFDRVKHYTKQSKVRPVVQARLSKLKRYIDRSWRMGPKGVFDDLR